jgi:uncharacterized protein YodC (DUF2158 family)
MTIDENVGFEVGDAVRVKTGGPKRWTIVGSRDTEPCWQIQCGNDGASTKWIKTDELELLAKGKKPESSPGFVPTRGIMD